MELIGRGIWLAMDVHENRQRTSLSQTSHIEPHQIHSRHGREELCMCDTVCYVDQDSLKEYPTNPSSSGLTSHAQTAIYVQCMKTLGLERPSLVVKSVPPPHHSFDAQPDALRRHSRSVTSTLIVGLSTCLHPRSPSRQE